MHDLVVIGGGITGAGIARDAALRGLKVALFEKGDYASGTSSKSSKMIHGGLRYLEQGDRLTGHHRCGSGAGRSHRLPLGHSRPPLS